MGISVWHQDSATMWSGIFRQYLHRPTSSLLRQSLKHCILSFSQKYTVNSAPDAEVLHGEWKSGSLLGIQCWRKVTQVQKMLLFFPDYNHLVENTKSGFQRNHYYIIQKCYPLAYMALLSFLKFWYRKCSPL